MAEFSCRHCKSKNTQYQVKPESVYVSCNSCGKSFSVIDPQNEKDLVSQHQSPVERSHSNKPTKSVPPPSRSHPHSPQENKSRYCTKCGNTVNGFDKFCGKCGENLNVDSSSAAQQKNIPLSAHNQSLKQDNAGGYISFLRIVRGLVGFLFGWQIVGLMPVLTWFRNPSAITDHIITMVFFKVVFLFVFGALFFSLRNVINRQHMKKYGSLHPSLFKKWAF